MSTPSSLLEEKDVSKYGLATDSGKLDHVPSLSDPSVQKIVTVRNGE
jgi:hypothetical protein